MADINPTKRQAWQGSIKKKQDQIKCYLQKTHFRSKDTNRIKISGWKKTLCKEPPQEN